jgi:hypothetical protein
MAWEKKSHSKYNGERERVSIALCVVLRHCRAKALGPFRGNNAVTYYFRAENNSFYFFVNGHEKLLRAVTRGLGCYVDTPVAYRHRFSLWYHAGIYYRL